MFRNIIKGPATVYDHTYKELMFFKAHLEKEEGTLKKIDWERKSS